MAIIQSFAKMKKACVKNSESDHWSANTIEVVGIAATSNNARMDCRRLSIRARILSICIERCAAPRRTSTLPKAKARLPLLTNDGDRWKKRWGKMEWLNPCQSGIYSHSLMLQPRYTTLFSELWEILLVSEWQQCKSMSTIAKLNEMSLFCSTHRRFSVHNNRSISSSAG